MATPSTPSPDELWSATHAERAALAEDLADLTDQEWAQPSWCGAWSVEEVVAHLTAAASIGPMRWIRSVLGARFDFDLHNALRLAEHRGATPAETLDRFRRIITSTTAPLGPTAAWLGEVVVHAGDIRRPLGIVHTPPVATVTEVARFTASRNFTVAGKTLSAGLRLEVVGVGEPADVAEVELALDRAHGAWQPARGQCPSPVAETSQAGRVEVHRVLLARRVADSAAWSM